MRIVIYIKFCVKNDLAAPLGDVSTSSKRPQKVQSFFIFFLKTDAFSSQSRQYYSGVDMCHDSSVCEEFLKISRLINNGLWLTKSDSGKYSAHENWLIKLIKAN